MISRNYQRQRQQFNFIYQGLTVNRLYPNRWQLCSLLLIASLSAQSKQKPSIPPITYENVTYGDHPNQIIDFWMSEVKGSAPLVIYIHGGAFKSGSHDKVDGDKIRQFLKDGVHHASIEYRFRQHAELPAAHQDVVRALQFIRSKAEEWGIDTNRIAAYGSSAGGQLVSYLAWHDDFSKPKSGDPIARQSSRLIAVAAKAPQSTMDEDWWLDNIPGYKKSFQQGLELSKPDARDLVKELSIINHISLDDPPTFMTYTMQPNAAMPSKKRKMKYWSSHHLNFGLALEKELKHQGVEVHLQYPNKKTAFKDDVTFLLHQLKKSAG